MSHAALAHKGANSFRRSLAIVALSMVCAVSSGCKKPLEWEKFSSPDSKFVVLMPGTPKKMVQDVPTAVGKLKMTMHAVELSDRRKGFAVAVADYPAGIDFGNEQIAHKVLDGVVKGIAKPNSGSIKKTSRIKIGPHHGQECLIFTSKNNTNTLCRVYLVRNRLYQLMTIYPTGASAEDAKKFLDSFKVTDNREGDRPNLKPKMKREEKNKKS